MSEITIQLGTHTFRAAPSVKKSMRLNYAIIEVPDGTDMVHVMGTQNKELILSAEEVSKADILDLEVAWDQETPLSLSIPDFEENITCRIADINCREVEGIPQTTYYDVAITVVKVEV